MRVQGFACKVSALQTRHSLAGLFGAGPQNKRRVQGFRVILNTVAEPSRSLPATRSSSRAAPCSSRTSSPPHFGDICAEKGTRRSGPFWILARGRTKRGAMSSHETGRTYGKPVGTLDQARLGQFPGFKLSMAFVLGLLLYYFVNNFARIKTKIGFN